MTNRNELFILIENMDDETTEILAAIAIKMSSVASARWTGKTEFILNSNQGRFGDCHISNTEVFRPRKKRSVRR